MSIKKYIKEISNNGNIEDMYKLTDMFIDLVDTLDQYDPKACKKYEMALYKIAYGNTFNDEMAQEIVNKMRPYGEKWSIEEVCEMLDQYGITNIKPTDFYIVINSAYNDYKDIFNEDIDMYIKFSVDFIEDEDAKNDKVFTYFTTIPKN